MGHGTQALSPSTPLRRPVAVLDHGTLDGYIPAIRAEQNLIFAAGMGQPIHEWTTTTRDGQPLTIAQYADRHGDPITYLIDPRPVSPSLLHGLLLALAHHIERTDNGRPIGPIQRIGAIRAVTCDDTVEQAILRQAAPPVAWESRAQYVARLRTVAEGM